MFKLKIKDLAEHEQQYIKNKTVLAAKKAAPKIIAKHGKVSHLWK
jgi:hypothetical protein